MAKRVAMGPVHAIDRALRRVGRGLFTDPTLTALATAIACRETSGVTGLVMRPGLDFTARDGHGRTILESRSKPRPMDGKPPRRRGRARAGESGRALRGRCDRGERTDVLQRRLQQRRRERRADGYPAHRGSQSRRHRAVRRPAPDAPQHDGGQGRVPLAHGARLDVRDDRSDRPGWTSDERRLHERMGAGASLSREGVSPAFRASDGRACATSCASCRTRRPSRARRARDPTPSVRAMTASWRRSRHTRRGRGRGYFACYLGVPGRYVPSPEPSSGVAVPTRSTR